MMEWIELRSTEPGGPDGDLSPLIDRMAGARVIGLGEPATGSREALREKHRLVALLARELDLSAVVLEANLADVIRVNEYALEGRGDPPVLLRRHLPRRHGTREMADLVRWMWDHNTLTSTKGRIALAGCDVQRIETAAEIVVETVRGLDHDFAAEVEKKYESVLEANRARWLSGSGIQAWFPVEEARDRRIRFSGHLRTEGVSDHACIWCWAGGDSGTIAHDALVGRRPRGTTAWREHTIDLDVPAETTHLGLGCFLAGRGRAWFDGLAVTLDGEPWCHPDQIDFDLATDDLTGFWVDPRARAVRDDEVRRAGKPTLLVESTGEIPASETSHLEAYMLAEQVLSDVMARWSASEAGRALRCALSVVQALEMRTGGGDASRARSMAENIEWLIARKPDARVVYWANNDAVARGGMDTGGFLARNLGESYLPMAFATASGSALTPSSRWREGLVPRELIPPPEGSTEAGLLAAGTPPSILDLRTVEPGDPEWGWLTNRRLFRATDDAGGFARRRLPDDFDLLVWHPETTPATPI